MPTCHRLPMIALALALGAMACGEAGPGGPRPRNLLVITVDTTRADHVGAYGSPLGVTPRIDALAQRGVVFETAYAPMAQTLPSHATMFTGLSPRRHGALENVYVLADDQLTLAELCAERGYATGGFIGALAIDHLTGIQQGFATFDEPRAPPSKKWETDRKGHPPQRKAAEVTRAALDWAEGLDGDQPFLLWAHYYDPHGDEGGGFDPPAMHLDAIDREAVAAQVAAHAGEFREGTGLPFLTEFWTGYAAEIRSMDEQIGVLLDGLADQGLLEDTVVAVVGDHGEGLWEHGQKAHGTHLWEEQVAIPFVLVSPDGAAAGTRVAGLVELPDLLPTLLSMAFGADNDVTPAGGEGLDLWSLVSAGQPLPERSVVMERPHYSAERLAGLRRGQGAREFQYGYKLALRRGEHKLLSWPDERFELYDLTRDEAELVDRADELPEVTAALKRELISWIRAHPSGPPGEVEVSDEKADAMRELGYMGDEGGESVWPADEELPEDG